jgi:hypothetical protein
VPCYDTKRRYDTVKSIGQEWSDLLFPMDQRAVPGIHHAIEVDNEWTMALDGLRVASQAAYGKGTIDFTPIQSTKDLENPIMAAPGEQRFTDTDPSKWEYRKRYFTVRLIALLPVRSTFGR